MAGEMRQSHPSPLGGRASGIELSARTLERERTERAGLDVAVHGVAGHGAGELEVIGKGWVTSSPR